MCSWAGNTPWQDQEAPLPNRSCLLCAEASDVMQPTGLDTVATYLSSAAEEEHPPGPRPQLPAGVDNVAGELAQGLGQQSEVLPAVEKCLWLERRMMGQSLCDHLSGACITLIQYISWQPTMHLQGADR